MPTPSATPAQDPIDALGALIIERLRPLTPEQRLDVLSRVGNVLCTACGYETPGSICYCTRDE